MDKIIRNAIARIYQERRRKSAADLKTRLGEVYESIPEIREIDREMSDIGVDCALKAVNSDEPQDNLSIRFSELGAKKSVLLISRGYGSDYLEEKYQCPKCRDTGMLAGSGNIVKCACYIRQYIDLIYRHYNVKMHEKQNFESFDENLFTNLPNAEVYGIPNSPRENMRNISADCKAFIGDFDNPSTNNLFFTGPTGTGKTFMCNCIAMELLKRGRSVLYQTAPSLFDTINAYKYNSYKNDSYDDAFYRDIFETELLIIDDLGTEPQSPARYAEFLNILNERLARANFRPCKTIISTNISPQDLSAYYDERVASRIIGSFSIYKFAGEDLRLA